MKNTVNNLFLNAMFLMFFLASSNIVSAQCVEQSLRLARGIDNCGQNGLLEITYTNGPAPYNISISNDFSGQSGSASTNQSVVNIGIFPGTWTLTVEDANGCTATTRFSLYANNMSVTIGDCQVNGRRPVTFANNSTSFIPVSVSIGSFGISLQAGTSSTVSANPSIYTATISRGGCTNYNLSFEVAACGSSRNSEVKVQDQKIEISEVRERVEVTIAPNPFSNQLTIDLDLITKEDLSAIIYDLSGKAVLNHAVNGDKAVINTESLDAGLYILRVTNSKGEEVLTQKVIKK